MKAKDRKRAIINLLITKKKAITGGELDKTFGVSTQIIVRDIVSLKDAGYDILSTHYGYLLHKAPFSERVLKFYHTVKTLSFQACCEFNNHLLQKKTLL